MLKSATTNFMNLTISRKIDFITSKDKKIVFIPASTFFYYNCLFLLGESNIANIKKFCKDATAYDDDIDWEGYIEKFDTKDIKELIDAETAFCVDAGVSTETFIFVPERVDFESVILHEIIHLVDFIMEKSGVSNDTEVRAYLFQHYEQTLRRARA